MPPNIAKASTQEVQAQLELIQSKISKAVACDERTGYLTTFLNKRLNNDALTKALAEFVQVYVVRVPVELVKLLNAAEKVNGLGKMQPLVDTIEQYYTVIRDDEIDTFGVLGLLQTSYAVNGLLQGIPRSSWAKPLLDEYFDYPKDYDVYIRSIIGESNMPGLDAMVSEALDSPGLQNSFSGVDQSPENPRGSQKPERDDKIRRVAIEDTYPDRPVIVPVLPALVPQKKMSEPAGESAGSTILDTKFGSGGKVTASLKEGAAAGLAIQADGKFLVLGTSSDLKDTKGLTLLRYNPDGSLDNTLGGSGCLTFIPHNGFIYGRAISLQADGKIVLVGYEYVSKPGLF